MVPEQINNTLHRLLDTPDVTFQDMVDSSRIKQVIIYIAGSSAWTFVSLSLGHAIVSQKEPTTNQVAASFLSGALATGEAAVALMICRRLSNCIDAFPMLSCLGLTYKVMLQPTISLAAEIPFVDTDKQPQHFILEAICLVTGSLILISSMVGLLTCLNCLKNNLPTPSSAHPQSPTVAI
jgi:hypothetical protein